MEKPIRILLVDTSPSGVKGSMSRYGDIVVCSLSRILLTEPQTHVMRLRLSLSNRILEKLPLIVQMWINHIWIYFTSKVRINKIMPDIVHVLDGSYAYFVNRNAKVPFVCTAHDVIPLLQQHGKFKTMVASVLAGVLIKRAIQGLRNASQIIADSVSTQNDLIKFAAVHKKWITVVPIAIDPILLDNSEKYTASHFFLRSNPTPYLFHVGNNAYYKNREGVVRIYSKLYQHSPLRLVMAGPAPTNNLRWLVQALKLEAQVEFIKNPDDTQLIALYKNAALFLFPSLYEGFGWPPLEAMSVGCPVVCSSAGSLPEVVGNAALVAAANDEETLAALCQSVLNNPDLAESLAKKGIKRASMFTPERMGQQLISVYQNALKQQASA